jgi:hypothetical protein
MFEILSFANNKIRTVDHSLLKYLVAAAIQLFVNFTSLSQSILNTQLNGTENGKNLTSYFQEVERSQGVRFYFLPEWTDGIYFNESTQGLTLGDALTELFLGSELSYTLINANTVVLLKDQTQALERSTVLSAANREKKK